MNARELADLLGVNEVTIRRQIHSGKIEATKDGRAFKIPQYEVDRLLKDVEEVNYDIETKKMVQWMKFSIDKQIEGHMNGIHKINKILATGGEITDEHIKQLGEHAKEIGRLELEKRAITPETFKMEVDDDE